MRQKESHGAGSLNERLKENNLKIEVFGISREPRTSRSHVTRASPSGLRFERLGPRSRGNWFTARFFLHPKTSQSHVWEDIQLFRTLFCLSINEFCIKKRTFEDNFSAKIGVSGGIKQTWQPQQPTANRTCKTGNVKPLTANPSLSFAVKRSNLDLGLQLIKRTPIWVLLMVHFLCLQRNLRCKRFSICQDIENL